MKQEETILLPGLVLMHGQDLVLADAVGADQNEAGGDDLAAGLGLDDLQSGTDRVGGGVGGAAQQSVGVAHLHQHGAEVVALLQQLAALVLGHLALAQLHHQSHHLVHLRKGLGIDDLRAADVEAGFLGGGHHGLRIAHQDGGQEGAGQQTGGRLQNAGIRALGEDDLPGMGLQLIDQKLKHLISSKSYRIRAKTILYPLYTTLRPGQLKNQNNLTKISEIRCPA